MKHRPCLLITLLCLAAIWIMGCSGQPAKVVSTLTTIAPTATGVAKATSTPLPSVDKRASLVNDLRAVGVNVEPGEMFVPDIFTGRAQTITINRAPVTVYEYPDAAAAESEASWVSSDGGQITFPNPNDPGQMITLVSEPAGTPHYFRRETLIVSYTGDSPPIINALEAVLGPQFAGGPVPEPGTIPRHYRYGTLPAPNLAYVGQVLIPPAWLATDDSAVPASRGSFEINDRSQGLVQHADGVPPQMLGNALATARLGADQTATVIIFIPYGSVQSVRATIQPWSEEPVFDPDAGQVLMGEGQHREDFYSYTLNATGQAGDMLLALSLRFGNDQSSGELTYFWRLNLAEAGAQVGQQTAPDQLNLAGKALITFFDYLSAGQYQQAAELYGGSYELLVEYNPDVDPQDHAALLQNACTVNGFQCLRVVSAVRQEQASPTAYSFVVEFENSDGSLFVRGPCCGADETTVSPQSQFTFTLLHDGGSRFLVQELPIYLP